MNLDGTDKITPTPFDAHEQVARKPHEEAEKEPLSVHSGLKAAEYEHQEYPKAITLTDDEGKKYQVVAKDEDHEAEILES